MVAILWLAVVLPFANAFTYTSTQTGADVVTYTSTEGNGNVEQLKSTSSYTTYFIFMNDDKIVSTFIGIPVTTTDAKGNPSTYLSREEYYPSGDNNDGNQGAGQPTLSSLLPSTSASATPSQTEKTASASSPTTSEAETTDTLAKHSSKANVGAIAGGIAGGLVVLIILAIVGWFYKRKRDRKRHLEEHKKEEMQLLAMELDGSYNPKSATKGNPMSDFSLYTDPNANTSITDDLASKYTGNSHTHNLPSLRDTYNIGAYPISIGAELNMDSQGRMGMPDGSPFVIDSILPLRNAKVADSYTDLEWFPLVTGEQELMQHSGPSYIEEKELSHVAMYIQKPNGLKGVSSAGVIQRRL
ncbi:hypothetical protein GGI25_006252 [Coemansia spiralis]|uniref:Uncharacterized protein n=2 Tax=Coemansia TaxID=4863 RepID=A0A9W8G1Q9_9FUNG|nr:hypothetical protein BX070DRAFT_57755 [Coemansia spiralis]KAJ1986651.1 hypothetical protein EDC05_006214 [Coemansia umbellata]KAJ2618822.1 hypothetical protein GGI26_006323 [Coemansia sp. RSA 1358]KAJ2669123.1 hypothetical protein GGI25_006252 [Coemansia spiralis]